MSTDVLDPPSSRNRTSAATKTFRKDIQGLRAVAVLSVALDHAHVPHFSGGFVGVDVFFVISGFLITQLLLAEAHRAGSISLSGFYSRRARRILPAATLVTVVTTLASVWLLDFVRAAAVIGDAVWATFFGANIKFGRDQTDYFSSDLPPSPLQHYWSLSIEEQFYVVWPVLLACVYGGYAVWRRRRSAQANTPAAPRMGVAPVLVALVLLGGGSLMWSISLTGRDATAAYFSTPARVWELAVGAACAALAPALTSLPGRVKALMSWVGMLCIGVAIVGFGSRTSYPGQAALLPVIGAALVIGGGCGLVNGGAHALLRHRPFQLVGDWSYSMYLWHWPFLVIAAGYVGHPLTWHQNLLLVAAALATSFATYRWVENPFRRPRRTTASRRRGLLLYPAGITLTLVGCLTAHLMVQQEVTAASSAPPITVHHFGGGKKAEPRFSRDPAIALVQASVRAARNGLAIPGGLNPPLMDLRDDNADVGECEYGNDIRTVCERGVVGSHHVMILVGDSHARAWVPALDRIALREGFAVYYFVKPDCGAAEVVVGADADTRPSRYEGCLKWQTWARDTIRDLDPDVTLVSSDMTPGDVGFASQATEIDDDGADQIRLGLHQAVSDLKLISGRLVVIGDVPGLRELPGSCLAARGANLADCASPPNALWSTALSITRDVARADGVEFINPFRWFCADQLCPAVVGSTVTYRDQGHISTTYSAQLADPLAEALALSSGR